MQKLELAYKDVRRRADKIASKINEDWSHVFFSGVPRGGIPAMLLVASAMQSMDISYNIVDDYDDATVIIDDVVDSGETRARVLGANPDAYFYPLVNKQEEGIEEWVVFPWDKSDADGAGDIPRRLIEYIGEDPKREGLVETPERFLRAWEHWTRGYEQNADDVLKTFDDGAEDYDEMILLQGHPVWSMCEHHMAPFFGYAHVAYIPDGKIVGLSKLSRIVEVFARRLQVQERLTVQVADALTDNLHPDGVGVVLRCRHSCMESRGIQRDGMFTTTSAMRGSFMHDEQTRSEFFDLVNGRGR